MQSDQNYVHVYILCVWFQSTIERPTFDLGDFELTELTETDVDLAAAASQIETAFVTGIRQFVLIPVSVDYHYSPAISSNSV